VQKTIFSTGSGGRGTGEGGLRWASRGKKRWVEPTVGGGLCAVAKEDTHTREDPGGRRSTIIFIQGVAVWVHERKILGIPWSGVGRKAESMAKAKPANSLDKRKITHVTSSRSCETKVEGAWFPFWESVLPWTDYQEEVRATRQVKVWRRKAAQRKSFLRKIGKGEKKLKKKGRPLFDTKGVQGGGGGGAGSLR